MRKKSLPSSRPGLPDSRRALTVGAFLERWLDDVVAVSVRPTTAASYRYVVARRLIPEFGGTRLVELNATAVQGFLARELRRGQAASTVRQTLRILRVALERARRFGLVRENVARAVATPRVARPVIIPLDPRSVRGLLRAARGEPVERVLALGLMGLRAGEVRGLRWEDLEFARRRLHVRRTAQWAGRGLDILPPKTRASVRTLSLPRFVARALVRVPRRERRGFVFAGPRGTPLHGTVLQRWLDALVERAGVKREVTMHLLRHTAAAMLLESAVHLRVVMNVLGHVRMQTTIELYGHLRPELHADAARVMDAWVHEQR